VPCDSFERGELTELHQFIIHRSKCEHKLVFVFWMRATHRMRR
jgi:hypothetical protein